MESYCLGTKQFVLKEELSTLPHARKALARFVYCKTLILSTLPHARKALARFVYCKTLILSTLPHARKALARFVYTYIWWVFAFGHRAS